MISWTGPSNIRRTRPGSASTGAHSGPGKFVTAQVRGIVSTNACTGDRSPVREAERDAEGEADEQSDDRIHDHSPLPTGAVVASSFSDCRRNRSFSEAKVQYG